MTKELRRRFRLRPTASIPMALAGIALVGGATAAHSQALESDRDVGVLQRPHPEYDPLGIRLGAFIVRPEIDLGVNYNDNLYATESNQTSDSYFTVKPSVTIASDWSRNAVSLTAEDTSSFYSKQTTENSGQWNLIGNGRLDIHNDADVTAMVSYGHEILPRTSASYTQITQDPIEYYRGEALLTGDKEFNRFKFTGDLDFVNYNYENGNTASGAVVDESFQSRNESYVTGRLGYALSPATSVFVSLTGSNLSYDNQGSTQGRNGGGERLLAGVNFDITHLSRGEVSFGYNNESFSRANSNINGYSYKALVYYYPTELLTVTLNADRVIDASNVIYSVGYTADTLSLEGDYELLRNLIVTSILTRSSYAYQGISRNDDVYGLSVGGTYYFNRDLGIKLLYSVLNQDSSGSLRGPNFTQQVVGLSAVIRH